LQGVDGEGRGRFAGPSCQSHSAILSSPIDSTLEFEVEAAVKQADSRSSICKPLKACTTGSRFKISAALASKRRAESAENARQKQALAAVDRMRNIEPQILVCEAIRDTVVFDKSVGLSAGGSRQHV
jgi:hypothetical protein